MAEKKKKYWARLGISERIRGKMKKGGVSLLVKSATNNAVDYFMLPVNLATKKGFRFGKNILPYYYHRFNQSWRNERTVEIPIALHYLSLFDNKEVLEVGNVMGNYANFSHDVVDKYEKAPGVLNIDIVDFKPKKKYDLILSISTMEHVGFDEEDKRADKIPEALEHLKKNCLKKGGVIVVTVPLGYNSPMDRMIFENNLKFGEKIFLKRVSIRNHWKEVSMKEVISSEYGRPYVAANAIMVGIIKN